MSLSASLNKGDIILDIDIIVSYSDESPISGGGKFLNDANLSVA